MHGKKLIALYFVLGLIAALIFLALTTQALNAGKVVRGTHLTSTNLSGLTSEAAKNKIDSLLSDAAKNQFKIKFDGKTWSAPPSELGIIFDAEKTAKIIRQNGRDKNFIQNTIQQLSLLIAPKKFNFTYGIDETTLKTFLKNTGVTESSAKNATLKYNKDNDAFIFIPAQNGSVIDRDNFKNQIERQLSAGGNEIIIKKTVQRPDITADPNDSAKTEAQRILSLAPVELTDGTAAWKIEKVNLADWLDFKPKHNSTGAMETGISVKIIKEYLSDLAPSINKEPTNASLTIKDGKVAAFSLSQNGTELKIDESADKIADAILSAKKKISLVIETKKPRITTQTIDMLGLTNLIGVGTSSFAGSPKNRVHNINVGAEKINGVLVGPGEEFSFILSIGEIDGTTGYLPELVIKGNQTIPEYGGGICQVSTTLFRAVINAGLKITERYPHAFPVKYYNPQGFDATIYPPHPDLRFLNDTPNSILIQSKIKDTDIAFEIYGTDDDREIKITGPVILESNTDGSMKTVLHQEVWRDGELERKDTFRSNYKSPALYPVAKNPLE